MKYDAAKFGKAAAYYRRALKAFLREGASCLVELPLGNERAFLSTAPLSRAAHELGADLSLFVVDGKSETLEALKRTWRAFSEKDGAEHDALLDFIGAVNKKTKTRGFGKLFRPPELVLSASPTSFGGGQGIELGFKAAWFRRRKWKQLLATCTRILTQGYGLKKTERFSVSFELIPKESDLELPLDDYLDNFSMAYAMALSAKKLCRRVALGASTSRMSQLEPMDRISDLAATLVGCEFEKSIDEPWFRAFRRVSKLLSFEKLKPAEAGFGISGKGYGGKHFFGLTIGYPTPNGKSRWQSPGQMFLKPFWLVQSRIDSRRPRTRYAITETLPIESFIRTCYLDYRKLRARDEKIRRILKKGKALYVRGKELQQGRTELQLDLSRVLAGKSPVLTSDTEVNPSTPKEAARVFKVRCGRYGNFPGGEVFLTPYNLSGRFVGDIVISIDQSYVIGNKEPLVVDIRRGHYRVVAGPKKILKALEKRKKESWRLIRLYEKNKSMPKSITRTFKRNFDMVGEIAINTNPKARLSRYLIETEKLARMMHIALGSGYEPKRETTYHCDIVLDCPRQRVDMWVVTPSGKELWIMRRGKLVV
jgi:hypothetical protein